jgi:hypothetical protein
MNEETGRFTVGVFQDVQWAERGLDALKRHGFPPEALSVIARQTPEAAALVERSLGGEAATVDGRALGPLVWRGPLVPALEGERGLTAVGLAAAMRRVGFQAHDGQIFETLTARGGVLVAIRSEPRAADALATLHAYGGGNAAIGAWTGRV